MVRSHGGREAHEGKCAEKPQESASGRNGLSILDLASAGAQRGRVAELLVAAELTARGYIIAFTNPDAPYDLVAERVRDHKLFRIQVKVAYNGKGGRYIFNTSRKRPKNEPRVAYHADDFDCFAAVCPDGSVAYVPHDEDTPNSSRMVTDEMAGEPV